VFIVWGRKITRKRFGYVVDFCPICRSLETFELQAVHSSGHVYYITLGGGPLVGYERKCADCGAAYRAESTAYATVAKQRLPFDELKRQTLPTLSPATQGRLDLEERIRSGRAQLAPPQRYNLIREPFLLLSPKVERRFASTHIDAPTGLALIGAVALMFAGGWIDRQFFADSAGTGLLIAAGIGAALIVWQFVESGSRYMRREIVPVLAKALDPLRPTPDEIERVLGELQQTKQKIGRKLKVNQLLESLSSSGSRQYEPLSRAPPN
jgi:hypothetical protein